MHFKDSSSSLVAGEILGLAIAYSIFTTVLFFVILFVKGQQVPFLGVASVTAALVLVGEGLRKVFR